MKTSENTMDLRIAKAMREAANVVFEAMPVSIDVNLTAMQVYEHFTNEKKRVPGMPKDNDWYANISACSGNGWEIRNDEEIVITVDSFTCKLFSVDIFRMLHTFERLANIKDRARFIYSVPKSEAAVTLNISVDKSAKEIFAHVAKDDLRPVMNSVYVDFVHSNIVASDGHTIQVMRCNIEGAQPEINGVAIPSHIAKNAFAKRSFVMTIDGDHITCNNESFDVIGRYPNYLSVWRSFRSEDDELIQLAPNAWKEVTSKAKAMQKQYIKVMFVFHALSGEHVITVDVWNFYENIKVNEFKVNTAAAVPVSFGVGFFTDSLTRFKGVSRLQGLDNGRGVVMYGADYLGILMPGKMEDLPVNYPMYESENKGTFAPIAAYEIKRVINEPVVTVETINEPVEPVETINEPVVTVETINEPVERVETINEPVERVETINESVERVETINESVEIIPENRMSATAFISSFVAMMAACILAFVVFVVKPRTIATAAPVPTVATISEAADVATISEAADVVTIEAEINDVICIGSIDPYIEHVKEEITRNYRAVMASQLQEIADNNNEVFAAIEAADVEPVAEEITPIYSNSEELEEIADTLTEEDADTADTITEDQSDTQSESEGEIIDYSCNGYTVLIMVTATPDGQPAINTYIEPIE